LIAIRHEANVNNEFTTFTGRANPALANDRARVGHSGRRLCGRYPDGDAAVQLLDSVRRKE
jgi:hypothetical protein